MTASKPIDVGEVILSEKAYSAVLYPEHFGGHCQTCFKRLTILFPCRNCCDVAYCSPICQERDSGHRVECQFTGLLTGLGCSQVARLALRMISQRSFDEILALKMKLTQTNLKEDVAASESDPYVQVYNLCHGNDSRSSDDKICRSLMASVLGRLLKEARYFPDLCSTFEYTYVCSLLLRNLQVLQFNAHEIYAVVRPSPKAISPCKNKIIALGIYPRASYFNHSCHGQVSRTFDGSDLVLRSLRGIPAGSEILENYGPTFYLKSFEERQRDLSLRYWFDCACEPCCGEWPKLKILRQSKLGEIELQRLGKAMKSGAESDGAIIEGLCQLQRNYQSETESKGEGEGRASESSGVGSSSRPPTEQWIKVEDKLRTCFSTLGNSVFLGGGDVATSKK